MPSAEWPSQSTSSLSLSSLSSGAPLPAGDTAPPSSSPLAAPSVSSAADAAARPLRGPRLRLVPPPPPRRRLGAEGAEGRAAVEAEGAALASVTSVSQSVAVGCALAASPSAAGGLAWRGWWAKRWQ